MKTLFSFLLIISSIALSGQEIGDYATSHIFRTPRLSAVQNLESGSFQLAPIDLTKDLRMQALRKQNSFSMRASETIKRTQFKAPNLFPKTQEIKKPLQFTVETRDYNDSFNRNFGFGNSFYGRPYVPYIPPRVN